MHAKESHDHEVFKNNLGISTVLQIRVCHNIGSFRGLYFTVLKCSLKNSKICFNQNLPPLKQEMYEIFY